jgi:tetratricopeptide (TPR) repeat protein
VVLFGLLLVLLGLGGKLLATRVWASYHLRAARMSAVRYHTRQALGHLARCGEVWADDPEVLLLSARVARRASDFERAQELLQRCDSRSQHDEDVSLEHVLLRAARGEVDQVADFCRALIDRGGPRTSMVLEAMAQGSLVTFRTGDAIRYLDQWLAREPDNTQALLMKASLFNYLRDEPTALAALRHALQVDPDHEAARLHLTAMLLSLNQPREALPHLEFLRRQLPDSPTVLARLGQCLADVGRTPEAEKVLDQVLATHPSFPAALAQRGILARQTGDLELAERLLTQACAQMPDQIWYYQLYLCLEERGKRTEARQVHARLKQLEQAANRIREIASAPIINSPNDPDLLSELGSLLLRTGDVRDGLRCLNQALAVAPDHAATHAALATYYEQTGQQERALGHRQAAQALRRPRQP